jgi:ferredoxin-NADP reductase
MRAFLRSKRDLCSETTEFFLEVSEPFEFIAGQYTFITLQSLIKPDERGPRRHFSIASAPNEMPTVRIATRVRETGFKQTLSWLEMGTELDISKPYGDLILDDTNIEVVFIAGGIGITPFMSMMKDVTDNHKKRKITLLYSNKNKATTAYFDEIQNLARSNPNIHPVITMTQDETWAEEKGRFDSAKIQKYVPNSTNANFYIVGPENMNQAVEDMLYSLRIPDDHIKREDFTGY